MDEVLQYFTITNLEELNKILCASANVVAEAVGYKTFEKRQTQDPWWKRRIDEKIKELRKDLSRILNMKQGKLRKGGQEEKLERKYSVRKKGVDVAIEELKQRITAKAAKMKRYEGRINQFRQNKLFQNNQKTLFEELEGNKHNVNDMPDAEKSRKFWSDIWSKEEAHNENAMWIKDVENTFAQKNKQENIVITPRLISKEVVKLPNWKAPGPDGLQGYWLKHIKSVRPIMAALLNDCLQQGDFPSWLTQGSTTLIMKDESKGAEISNFRLITCLPLIWKLLTGMISKGIYAHLDRENILPEEQKGCRKESRGTKDQLLIDKMVLKNCKRQQTDLAMGWIDYTKAYDMVPHSWILKSLEVTKVADNVIMLIKRSMSKWETELLSGKQKLGKVRIQRGIFQGDFVPTAFCSCINYVIDYLEKSEGWV